MGVYLYPNNTETELKNAYIGEYQEGWQPGANTIAYYPLNSTYNYTDQSGNGKNLTKSGTVTFGTYGGVDCAYFNGGYLYINESLVLGNNPRTISCRFNRQSNPSESGAFWGMGSASSTNGMTTYLYGGNPIGHYGYGNWQSGKDVGFDEMPTVGAWTLLTVTYDGTDIGVYVNGSYLGTPTYGGTPISTALTLNLTSGKTAICQYPNFGAPAWKGYMSNFIFENTTRASQDISDYYDLTKGDYGIS